jgi:predicted PurR-regulated permease PerM
MMPQNVRPAHDLTRVVLGVLFIGALIASTAWIMRPFLSALLWATMIVISTWPLLLSLQARLGGRRGLATTVLTVALLLILLIPLTLSVSALIGNKDSVVAWVKALANFKVPPPPYWVAHIPIRGPKLAAEWQQLSEGGPAALSSKLVPYAGRFVGFCVKQIGGMGAIVGQFLLTVIISAILYSTGETAASGIRKFFYRLAGTNGERAVILAAGTIRGVAIGVVVTAVIQTLIAGIGLVVASVPAAAFLTAACLMLCIAQLGPLLVMLPVVIWKFSSGDILWGCVLLAFALVAGTIDNFIRPILIRKGADLPLLLIFAGVIGGIISFGIMGIFVGPVVLAVTYALIKEWVEDKPLTEDKAVTVFAEEISSRVAEQAPSQI